MMTTEKQIEEANAKWKVYLDELSDKYKEIPQAIKTAIIEKDFKNMFGSRYSEFLNYDSTDWNLLLENAIAGLSRTVKKNILKKEWEWMAYKEFPNNPIKWPDFLAAESKKEYVKLIYG